MELAFDAEKCRANIAKHGLSFADFPGFDDLPIVRIDRRKDYGEVRYRAFGRIGGAPHCLMFTVTEETMRLISFRRAHAKEMRRCE